MIKRGFAADKMHVQLRHRTLWSMFSNRHDLLLVVFLASQLTIIHLLGPIALDMLTIQLSPLDTSVFRRTVARWGSEGTARFANHFWLDALLHPLLYGAFLRERVTVRLAPPSAASSLAQPLRLLAAFGAAFDVLENSVHMYLLRGGLEAAPDHLIRAAASAATAKWLMLLPVLCAVLPLAPWSASASRWRPKAA